MNMTLVMYLGSPGPLLHTGFQRYFPSVVALQRQPRNHLSDSLRHKREVKHFFNNFCDSDFPPCALLAKINGFGIPFWVKIRGKSESCDFVKIVLPLRWEHNFQGSDPPKIDLECDFERRWLDKSMKTALGAILGSAYVAQGRFFIDFGVPIGS